MVPLSPSKFVPAPAKRRSLTLAEQLRAAVGSQLYERARGLLEPEAAKLSAYPNVVVAFKARGRPTRLEGRCIRWVAPHTGGDRYSVTVYSAKALATPVSDATSACSGQPSPRQPP